MVSTQHDHFFRTGYFHCKDEHEHLDWEVAPVNIITKEDILGFVAIASNICVQKFEKVVKLPMDVSYYGYWVVD